MGHILKMTVPSRTVRVRAWKCVLIWIFLDLFSWVWESNAEIFLYIYSCGKCTVNR